jgi:hypothetical protein
MRSIEGDLLALARRHAQIAWGEVSHTEKGIFQKFDDLVDGLLMGFMAKPRKNTCMNMNNGKAQTLPRAMGRTIIKPIKICTPLCNAVLPLLRQIVVQEISIGNHILFTLEQVIHAAYPFLPPPNPTDADGTSMTEFGYSLKEELKSLCPLCLNELVEQCKDLHMAATWFLESATKKYGWTVRVPEWRRERERCGEDVVLNISSTDPERHKQAFKVFGVSDLE